MFLVLAAVFALVRAACTVAFSTLVAGAIASMLAGASLASQSSSLTLLATVVVLRAATVWATEVVAARGAAQVKAQLRRHLMTALTRLGPSWLARRNRGEVTAIATSGMDALDGYFTLFLPQLVLTAVVTPIILVAMFLADPISGTVVLVTLPLIPVFMILIGWVTQAAQQRQWKELSHLSGRFLDIVQGLTTLRIFGRERRQEARIVEITEQYRRTTMKVLRMSFLSGFTLELVASLSVAVVAVSIGLRLVDGSLGLGVGLFLLLLAPEAYLPLRQVGANYHAAADGVAAAEDVFAILEEAGQLAQPEARRPAAARGPVGVTFDSVSIEYDGVTAIAGFSASIEPGRLTVIAGPSGAGKSSIIAALLGFAPHAGRIVVGDALAGHGAVAWAPQRPGFVDGSVLDNITVGSAARDEQLARRALALAAGAELDLFAVPGSDGSGLSGGEAGRVTLARAYYRALERTLPVIALDEPSAALDDATELSIIEGMRVLAREGHTVIVASHRPAMIAAADDLITVGVTAHA